VFRTVVRKPQVPRLCVAECCTTGTPSPEQVLAAARLSWTVCRRRRANRCETPLVVFAVALTSPRCFPRCKSCPGARDRLAPASSPSSVAVSGESAAVLPLAGVPGRPILILRPRSIRATGSIGSLPVNSAVTGRFCKRNPDLLLFHV
jgi:hypothetical protein